MRRRTTWRTRASPDSCLLGMMRLFVFDLRRRVLIFAVERSSSPGFSRRLRRSATSTSQQRSVWTWSRSSVTSGSTTGAPTITYEISRSPCYLPHLRAWFHLFYVQRSSLHSKLGRVSLTHPQGVENTRTFLLNWLSFLHRYIPVGLLERLPSKINDRPPPFCGRSDLETLLASGGACHQLHLRGECVLTLPRLQT